MSNADSIILSFYWWIVIPFPFEGIYGYQHSRVKELQSGGVAVAFGVFYAQENIKEKLNYIFNL